jgi:hypothetical protein
VGLGDGPQPQIPNPQSPIPKANFEVLSYIKNKFKNLKNNITILKNGNGF